VVLEWWFAARRRSLNLSRSRGLALPSQPRHSPSAARPGVVHSRRLWRAGKEQQDKQHLRPPLTLYGSRARADDAGWPNARHVVVGEPTRQPWKSQQQASSAATQQTTSTTRGN